MPQQLNQNDIVALINAELSDWYDLKEKPVFIPGVTTIKTAYPNDNFTDYQFMLEAILGKRWTAGGKWTNRAEELLCGITKQEQCSFTNSGSSANLLATSALVERYATDYIITTALNFSTTLAPILQNNKKVIFIDSSPITLEPDYAQLEAIINQLKESNLGIVLAHTLGMPFDEIEVEDRCFENDFVWKLFDCCDGLGSSRNGYPVGSLCDLSTYSFYPAHQANGIEMGAVCSKSSELTRIVDSYCSWGRQCKCLPNVDNTCGKRLSSSWPNGDCKFTTERVGYNMKTTEIQLALLASQLNNNFDEIQPKRMEVFRKLSEGIADLSEYMQPITVPVDSSPSPFYYAILLKEPLDKLTMMRYLENHKIQTRVIVNGNTSLQPAFAPFVRSGQIQIPYPLIGTTEISERMFGISCSQNLTDPMIEYIVTILHSAVKEMIK